VAQRTDGIGLPAQLVALGVAGGVVLGYGRKDRTTLGRLAELALLGAAVWVALGIRIVPLGAARRSVSVRTSLIIKRPVADVFGFFRDFTNFPALVGGLSSVEDFDDGRSRWKVQTFAGRTLEWDTVLTKFVPNQVIGWQSTPGGDVESSGVVRFEALGADETKIDIELRYRPLRTDVVEALYALHESRQENVETDLMRIGDYIESRSTGR
jgi:uncharacterized membrane protein